MQKGSTLEKKTLNRGYAAAVGSALFLSLTAIFIRYLTFNYQMPALILAFWREVFVAVTLLGIFIILKHTLLGGIKGSLGYLVGYGLALALFNALWTFSVTLNGAAVATVLVYSSAGFTVLLGWLVLKEKLTLLKILIVGVSLIGCSLVVNAFDPSLWGLNPLGVIVGASAGLLYAIYSIMGKSAAQRGLNTWTTIFYIFAFASVFMFIFNLSLGGKSPAAGSLLADLLWLGNSWQGWGVLGVLAIGPTLVGFGLYNISLKYLSSSTVNLVVMVEPVFTALIAFFLFGELLSVLQIVGAGLILASVGLTRE